MSSYPTSIVTLASHSDTTDTIFAADINTPNAEIVAVETGLLTGFQHDLLPLNDDAKSLGSTSKRWLKLWVQDLDLDGTVTMGGTATTVLHGNAAGGATFGAVALGSDVSGVLPPPNGGAGVTNVTSFETAARFGTTLAGSGGNTFDGNGLTATTGATGASTAGVTWLQAVSANSSLHAGSPRMTWRIGLITKGTDADVYVGSNITIAGAAISFIQNHVGFKVTWTGSGTASLFATQGNGSTELASSALTTLVAGDDLDLILIMNGTTSCDYYWRKNGGALSSVTTLTGTMPLNVGSGLAVAIGNHNAASSSAVNAVGMSYAR